MLSTKPKSKEVEDLTKWMVEMIDSVAFLQLGECCCFHSHSLFTSAGMVCSHFRLMVSLVFYFDREHHSADL